MNTEMLKVRYVKECKKPPNKAGEVGDERELPVAIAKVLMAEGYVVPAYRGRDRRKKRKVSNVEVERISEDDINEGANTIGEGQ